MSEQIAEPDEEKELGLVIKYLKNEVNQMSKTFRQSYKKTVAAWYESLGRKPSSRKIFFK